MAYNYSKMPLSYPPKTRFFAKKGMILEIRLFGLYLNFIVTYGSQWYTVDLRYKDEQYGICYTFERNSIASSSEITTSRMKTKPNNRKVESFAPTTSSSLSTRISSTIESAREVASFTTVEKTFSVGNNLQASSQATSYQLKTNPKNENAIMSTTTGGLEILQPPRTKKWLQYFQRCCNILNLGKLELLHHQYYQFGKISPF